MSTALNGIKETIREVFLSDLGIEISNDEENFFFELGVDSMAYLNVISRLEKRFTIKFANEELPNFQTCNILTEAIEAAVLRKAA